MDKKGRLSSCWEQFLVQFLRHQHRATLILATKEWHGWSSRDGQSVVEITVPLLTQKDSVQLLQRLGLEGVPIEYLNAISERVAGIPLCLEWIVRMECSLSLRKSSRIKVKEKDNPSIDVYYTNSYPFWQEKHASLHEECLREMSIVSRLHS